jgi:hypothetical protein
MQRAFGGNWWLRLLTDILIGAAAVALWLINVVNAEPLMTPSRIHREFPAAGIGKIFLRAAEAGNCEVAAVPAAKTVEVSGVPAGGAKGYHSPDPNWRETPAEEWGLDFVFARYGEALIISSKNEIHYIHHHYILQSVVLRGPAGVEVVREPRKLTGDDAPDLEAPKL